MAKRFRKGATFEERVERDETTGCLLWRAATSKGYGFIKVDGKARYAHRHAYETANEELPRNALLEHTCGNSLCCEPSHMEVVLRSEMHRDRIASGTKYGRAAEDIRSRIKVDPVSGCHEWHGANARGYGRIRRDGVVTSVHRYAYEVKHGPIPPGAYVCHHCDNPRCCNPDHLFLGSQAENMRDMTEKGRGPDRRGTKNSSAKLTAGDVKLIRDRASRGEALDVLADDFGLTRRAVSMVVSRETWKHIH